MNSGLNTTWVVDEDPGTGVWTTTLVGESIQTCVPGGRVAKDSFRLQWTTMIPGVGRRE